MFLLLPAAAEATKREPGNGNNAQKIQHMHTRRALSALCLLYHPAQLAAGSQTFLVLTPSDQ